ncbi:hypothetical protein Pelo_18804 [Pelomyxa schiedti]|nr:hypothetical protein Pelo_18804 [Pelomyxa schiedti]
MTVLFSGENRSAITTTTSDSTHLSINSLRGAVTAECLHTWNFNNNTLLSHVAANSAQLGHHPAMATTTPWRPTCCWPAIHSHSYSRGAPRGFHTDASAHVHGAQHDAAAGPVRFPRQRLGEAVTAHPLGPPPSWDEEHRGHRRWATEHAQQQRGGNEGEVHSVLARPAPRTQWAGQRGSQRHGRQRTGGWGGPSRTTAGGRARRRGRVP